MVKSKGAEQSIEMFKYLHTKGKNDTTMNILRMMNKAMHPEAANNINEVEIKINKWKEDLRYLAESSSKGDFSSDQKNRYSFQ